MPIESFDRAAEFYDQTRGYAEGSAEGIRDGIVRYTGATPQTRFLELGVGTGRVGLAFIQGGYDFTGVDISQAMMDQIPLKLAGDPALASYRYRLHQADVTSLPFAAGSFDVVIGVHIIHLLDEWQKAILEARRVLRPGGWLLISHDEPEYAGSEGKQSDIYPTEQVQKKWREILEELGGERNSGRLKIRGSEEVILEFLRESGAKTGLVNLAAYRLPPLSPREMAERLKGRIYCSDWKTPASLHEEAARRLDRWLAGEFPEPDRQVSVQGQFQAMTATWPEERGGY